MAKIIAKTSIFLVMCLSFVVWAQTGTFNFSTLAGTGTGYTWDGMMVLTVNNGANIEITGAATGGRRIEVAENARANVKLNGVSITGLSANQTPLLLNSGANLGITLVGENVLTAGSGRAGIEAPDGTTLSINGEPIVVPADSRAVKVAMQDSYGDGWQGAALRIAVNGVNVTSSATVSSSSSSNTYSFIAKVGDLVEVYWVKGSYDSENSFSISYADDNSTTLLSRARNTLNSVSNGTLLGSFTVTAMPAGTAFTMSGDGSLAATGSTDCAGIGGCNGRAGGTITINGGTVRATGGSNGAGIGGGGGGASGTITIDDGTVTATGGSYGAGIGSGNDADNERGNITIIMRDSGSDGWDGNGALRISVNGTYISPNPRLSSGGSGTTSFSADVGDVVEVYWSGNNTYNTESAFAIYYTEVPLNQTFNPAAGATNDDSRILLSRQYNSLTSSSNGVLLGSFTSTMPLLTAVARTITINGGVVTATGGSQGAGIGGGSGSAGGSITISGGVVTATNGVDGAGIGGGRGGTGGTIVIGGGTITAIGSRNIGDGAGIGGGRSGSGGTITISNGTVTATGSSGAGIGGGSGGSGGTITISGGTVTTTGTSSMGIGGASGTITISSGIITATGSSTGIGGTGSAVTISGGTVAATGSSSSGTGIGGTSGTINISGGIITATGGSGSSGKGISGDVIITSGGVVTAIGGSGTVGTLIMNNQNGGALVFASNVSDMTSKTSGILVIGNTTYWFGGDEFTLTQNAVVPANYTLTILSGKTLIIQQGVTLTVAKNAILTIPAGVTLTNNGTVIPADTSTVSVLGTVAGNKINGANVRTLTSNSKTTNSITLNAATLLATTGQTVEYAINASNSVPTSGWQTSTAFSELTPGTNYYLWARSAGNANFSAGTASISNSLLCFSSSGSGSQYCVYGSICYYESSSSFSSCKTLGGVVYQAEQNVSSDGGLLVRTDGVVITPSSSSGTVMPSSSSGTTTPSSSSGTAMPSSSSSGGSTPIRIVQIVTANSITPTQNAINLHVQNTAHLQIYNLNGKLQKTLHFTNGAYNVPMESLPKGMYIVKVTFGSEKIIRRIVVK
jgi:hypothetical protein